MIFLGFSVFTDLRVRQRCIHRTNNMYAVCMISDPHACEMWTQVFVYVYILSMKRYCLQSVRVSMHDFQQHQYVCMYVVQVIR